MKLDENILKACKGLVMNCNCKVLILDVLGEHRVFLVNDVHLKTRECRFNEVHECRSQLCQWYDRTDFIGTYPIYP